MNAVIAPSRPATSPADSPAVARLRTVATQMQGAFTRELFSAMRATVPTDGELDGGAGEEMFTGMMDENMADTMAAQMHRGIGDRIVEQLRHRVEPAATPAGEAR
ncbi:MAG TPA: rod-binding protein [Gemmatimonadaceae bacterium]|nr:rod-binding protein [Gemmatimonadaceae bacterium]